MKATWVQPDGQQTTLDVAEGQTFMEVATAKGVAGIIGECGGSMSCATCHVVVEPAWFGRSGPVGTFEDQMLDVTEADRQPTSRLSCQFSMAADLDGVILHVPQP